MAANPCAFADVPRGVLASSGILQSFFN